MSGNVMYDTSDFDGYLWWRLEQIWRGIALHRSLMGHGWQKGPEPGICKICGLSLERCVATAAALMHDRDRRSQGVR